MAEVTSSSLVGSTPKSPRVAGKLCNEPVKAFGNYRSHVQQPAGVSAKLIFFLSVPDFQAYVVFLESSTPNEHVIRWREEEYTLD